MLEELCERYSDIMIIFSKLYFAIELKNQKLEHGYGPALLGEGGVGYPVVPAGCVALHPWV